MHVVTVQAATGTLAEASDLAHAAVRGLASWWWERRTARALEALDDAPLKDFGVYRCETPWLARSISIDAERQ